MSLVINWMQQDLDGALPTGAVTGVDSTAITDATIVTADLGDIAYVPDSSGNESIKFGETASAVNEVTVTNAATAGNPVIAATGGDTNIGLTINQKAAALITLGTTSCTGVKLGVTQPLMDANGNELFKFTATGTAVNEFTVVNAATGNPPAIQATGGDTNINVLLTPKGTGLVTSASAFASTANAGATGAGVTAIEYGNGKDHLTVLTLTAVSLGAPTAGGNSAHGALIYTFPAGAHMHSVTYMDVGLTIGTVTTDTPDVGIGSLIGSGAQNLLSGVGATAEDYITGQTWNVALDGTHFAAVGPIGAVAGIHTGISLNGASGTKAVNLNAADGWAAGVTGNLTADGTIVLRWTDIA